MEDMSYLAEENFERHIFRRLGNLFEVRRFLISWLLLIILLIGGVIYQTRALGRYYQEQRPVPGGVYIEGIVGTFTDANPLYATGSVDGAVAKLVFSGLFKFDEKNELVGDLAERFEVDERGSLYTVKLRPDLTWHDGHPLTAEDVEFTYKTIQSPDAKSPLRNSWQGVGVKVIDPLTIEFSLPNALSAFPYSMTNGIVPKHLLHGIPHTRLRSIAFNTAKPIGSGPFKWDAVEVKGSDVLQREQHISLVPNESYHGGKPKLSRFIIRTFPDEKRLIESLDKQELTGAAGLNAVPESSKQNVESEEYNIPLTSANMVFFKTTQEPLNDPSVRRALVLAADTNEIIKNLGYPVIPVNSPLLKSHLGYARDLVQQATNVDAANATLDAAGWLKGEEGIRFKNGKPLTFRLFSESSGEFAYITQVLQRQWRAVGIDAQVFLEPADELQTTITFHNYDALLYGISLGNDPDVFAYWHSSQADIRSPNRLNLSEYKSVQADRALEAGRTRAEAALRTLKYRPFLEAWRADAPALSLYQPRFLYVTRTKIFGFEPTSFNTSSDRFSNVHNWMIREARVKKQ